MYTTYYAMLDPNSIFGMIGRCGGGYNTVWEDWTQEGRSARESITAEYEQQLNSICGHYAKLEQSILAEGFRNPLIITCGLPVRKPHRCLPPEYKLLDAHKLLIMEGTSGGSRLWVAQKYNIPVPCLVNDFTGKFVGTKISSIEEALAYYADKPASLVFDPKIGIVEAFDNTKIPYHMGNDWREDKVIIHRAPMWVSIMNKYGYYVDRLSPSVQTMLKSAGVVQPDTLKKRFDARG